MGEYMYGHLHTKSKYLDDLSISSVLSNTGTAKLENKINTLEAKEKAVY
jgi:hypothetical protein